MKKTIVAGLLLALFLVSTSSCFAATVIPSAKKTTIKTPYRAPAASTSDQISAYYKTRPYFSTSTKDKLIATISTSSVMDVSSLGLYPVNQIRNNQYEEQGNYYIAQCENEILYNDYMYNLRPTYTTDSLRKIKTTIFGPKNEFSVTFDGAWLKAGDYLGIVSTSTDRQKQVATQHFVSETKDGYAWFMVISSKVYTPKCASWMFDREIWTNRSIGGYQYGFDLFYPYGTVFYNIRGEKKIKGNQVEFQYSSSPFGVTANPVYNTNLFDGSEGNKVPRTQDFYYVFRKGNILFNVSLYTDKPRSHTDADKIITSFFN